ncbi:ABC transporter ATP-binding protein [Auritidibacter sp. NML130574]|uniref:ABC transporter ATP-binding protein n=1 Tax=Auritidibacter sp. NML130574 TaxID=2170745 RepID=UPI000D73A453|nr:ABC transporter ATP-binding protein [Auritidibacter sp. NML130574]AXR74027.1 ABC transporter ATP-binding protein [Auritidibacter sp. NML130574]
MTSSSDYPTEGLRLDGIGAKYGTDDWALHNISLKVGKGTTLAVLGPSGCGKSTLLKIVAGSLRPAAGTISMAGETISSPARQVPTERRGLGMVFQDYALWPHLNVRQTIGYGLKYGRNKTDSQLRTRRVAELMEMLQLSGLENRKPGELSGGQQQRVSIARALATRPSLLLFDEPLSNLDASLRDEMREELKQLFSVIDTTVLYVTHDITEALSLADKILVLHEGERVQLAKPEELFTAPASGWVANITGFTTRLELDRLDISTSPTSSSTALLNDKEIVGRWCGPREDGAGRSDEPVAYIHPDAVTLSENSDGIAGTVVSCNFEGRQYRIRVRLHDQRDLIATSTSNFDVGQSVSANIEASGAVFFGNMS